VDAHGITKSLTSAAPSQPAPPPCTRRTSRASLDLPADALLMLAVGGLRTPKRACQVACGVERSRGTVDAPGQPRGNLLEQPAVAVRIPERGERAVASPLFSAARSPNDRSTSSDHTRSLGVEQLDVVLSILWYQLQRRTAFDSAGAI
jgi:hypothetical protein